MIRGDKRYAEELGAEKIKYKRHFKETSEQSNLPTRPKQFDN